MNNPKNPLNIQVGSLVGWYGAAPIHPVVRVNATTFWVTYRGSEYSYCLTKVGDLTVDNSKIAPVAEPVITIKPALTPQAQTVLRHIRRAGSITQRDALMDHSVQSLTKAISIINAAGHKTKTTFKRHPLTNQRYAEYTLVGA